MFVVWMTQYDTPSTQAIYWLSTEPSKNYTATGMCFITTSKVRHRQQTSAHNKYIGYLGTFSHYYEPLPPYESPSIHCMQNNCL